MKSLTPTHLFTEVLHHVWEPELKKLKEKLVVQLGTIETRSILKEAWELAISEAHGLKTLSLSSKLLLFPALCKGAQAIGRLVWATWQENEADAKEAEVELLELGRSKLVVDTRRYLKRARATVLLQQLSAALRRHDRETAAWLSQSLQSLGYMCEVAAAWHAGPKSEQASA